MKTNKGKEEPKEMVGGCCVCSDENGWTENPLVYCDGQGCNVAVHQACYGIVAVPTGSWYCRKCESLDKTARGQRCELCPSKSGALKRTDSGGWAHVVCALYIPEVRFGNVTTMEPIMLQLIPQERFNKTCCICEEKGKLARAHIGACMQCNKPGCKQHFHVICAQAEGLLCEEAGNYMDNVKYCGYCQYHYSRIRKGTHVKAIPPYRPVYYDESSDGEPSNSGQSKDLKLRKKLKFLPPLHRSAATLKEDQPPPSEVSSTSKASTPNTSENPAQDGKSKNDGVSSTIMKGESKDFSSSSFQAPHPPANLTSTKNCSVVSTSTISVVNTSAQAKTSMMMPVATATSSSRLSSGAAATTSTCISIASRGLLLATRSSTPPTSQVSASSTAALLALANSCSSTAPTLRPTQSKSDPAPHVGLLTTVTESIVEKGRKGRRTGQRTPPVAQNSLPTCDSPKDAPLVICEEKPREELSSKSGKRTHSPEEKLNIQYTTNMSAVPAKSDNFGISHAELTITPSKKPRLCSQERGRRTKRGAPSKRGRVASYRESSLKVDRDSEGSSPDSFTSEIMPVSKRGRSKKVEVKEPILTNGVGANTLLLGNQINPSSAVAQKMADTLSEEIQAHSIYKEDEKSIMSSLVGPSLPGKKDNVFSGSVLGSSQPPPLPQSLEQLLERQWEQGSQFLMEQAQHFDIASLLSCLHQLRQENARLEETVTTLIARRDHLLAVNARLSVPLTSSNHSYPSAQAAVSSPSAPSSTTAHASAIVNSAILTSRSHPPHRHPSGGGPSGGSHATVVRGNTSPHDRRVSQSQHPIENGLPESEYRYRQGTSNSEFQHRQQSPMLPPGVQQSPNSIRQSPANSSYHSSSSPQTGVPSLSPSGVVAPNHNMVVHSHPPIMVSSHGHVSLNRIPDHSRAELVRLTGPTQPSIQQHSGPYPVYPMVSPPVGQPGSHHSPVGLSQHPSHSQLIRREVDSSRGGAHSSSDKR